LAGDPHGLLAFFDKAGLIEHDNPIGVPHRFSHELMVAPEHMLFVPRHITDEALQASDTAASRNSEGHRLDGFARERAQLARHIVKEMGSRLTPRKAVMKGRLKMPEFVQQPSNIVRGDFKGRDGKRRVSSAACG
jgi:hypothetical protein